MRATMPPRSADTRTSRTSRNPEMRCPGARPSGISLDHFSFGRTPAQLVGQPLAVRRERKADGVDAIALARRRRAIIEDMPLVSPASGADDLGPEHAVARVANVLQVIPGERLGEAGPAGAALEFRAAAEKRKPAQAAGEHPGALFVEEHAAERRLGAMFEKNVTLFIVEICDETLELLFCRLREG